VFERHWIANLDYTTAEHTGGDTSMPANGVVPACAEGFFHSRARMTGTSPLHQHATDRELRPAQRQQIDATHYDIPTQQCGIHSLATQELRHYRKMLSLNQRHLSFARRTASVAVAGQSLACASLDTVNDYYRLTSSGTHSYPFDPARARQAREQFIQLEWHCRHLYASWRSTWLHNVRSPWLTQPEAATRYNSMGETRTVEGSLADLRLVAKSAHRLTTKAFVGVDR
jgi:hypothetical protein